MPQGMPKVDKEIERICEKVASNKELLKSNLNILLHHLVIVTIQEYRKMMADDVQAYQPEDVRHG